MALAPSSSKKKVFWFWQSESDSFDSNEKQRWERYSDFENEYIEQEFQKDQKQVELNDFVIDFELKTQYNKDNIKKRKQVKREQVDLSQYVREERFNCPVRILTKTFNYTTDERVIFAYEWCTRNKQIVGDAHYQIVAELAAHGLLVEGKLLNKDFDANRMAERLRSCTDMKELQKYTVTLYSAASFLYGLLNSTLRNHDDSKIDTLGPFSYLLWQYLVLDKNNDVKLVYRGVNLTQEMIEEYKQAISDEGFRFTKKKVIWPAFTSTTKDRQVAEIYGNTLFIINLLDGNRKDISSLSIFPDEQEVLLGNDSAFVVDNVEYNSITEKHTIRMREPDINDYEIEFYNDD